METNQELNRMSKDVSTLLRILRSVNNLGSKMKSEDSKQSILKNLTIFKDEYTCCFSRTVDLIWIDLTVFSTFTLFNSSTLQRPRSNIAINRFSQSFFFNTLKFNYCSHGFKNRCNHFMLKFSMELNDILHLNI